MEQDADSIMWKLVDGDIAKVSGRTAFDAMRQKDATGKRVVDQYIRYLACGLVNIINIFQPDTICIGGGICNEGETLLAPVREIIEAERYSKYSAKQTRICIAQLGNDAGIVGAACLRRS
jgi:glucokinase